MSKEIEGLWRDSRKNQIRLEGMVARGVVTKTDDAKKVQRFQLELLADEVEEDVEHFQPQGLSFAVEPGAEAVVLAVGADRAHSIAICAQDPAKRPTAAKPGTGGLYTKKAWRVFIDADNVVHIGAETGEEFIAMAQKVQDQFDEIRKKVDANYQEYITFTAHTHIVATAGSPAAQTGTAAPVTPPAVPAQPLGPATPVAAKFGKVT